MKLHSDLKSCITLGDVKLFIEKYRHVIGRLKAEADINFLTKIELKIYIIMSDYGEIPVTPTQVKEKISELWHGSI